jgi:Fungal chitosanase of glycosyl hydrolase group 75
MSTSPGKHSIVEFGTNSIWVLNAHLDVPYWTCPLHIDADGSPHAYHPPTSSASSGSPPGLDYLANAGKPGNWWGIACDPSGKPFVQNASDPAPGFYVSTTSLMDSSQPARSPLRYIDSESVPFFVLPSKPKFHSKQKLGDLAMIFNNDTGKYHWAIYADVGPSNQIGEGSMALAKALGLSDSPKTGGTEKEIIAMVMFAGSSLGWPKEFYELGKAAYKLWDAWGGYESAKYAMPQFNWDQFPPIPIPLS